MNLDLDTIPSNPPQKYDFDEYKSFPLQESTSKEETFKKRIELYTH